MPKFIKIQNIEVSIKTSKDNNDFICLTDMAKMKNAEFPADVVKNWLRTKYTIEFIGIWEQINNSNFNLVVFNQFKNEAGDRTFVMSPEKWIKSTFITDGLNKVSRAKKLLKIANNQKLVLTKSASVQSLKSLPNSLEK